jgi:hypothetical protein
VDDARPFTAAELNFFSDSNAWNGEPTVSMCYYSLTTLLVLAVPMMVIFTKFDALEDKVFSDLLYEGLPFKDAVNAAPARAIAYFKTMHLGGLYQTRYPPKGHVCLRGKMLYNHMCRGHDIQPPKIWTSLKPIAINS